MDLSLAADLDFQPFGQRINNRRAHAMQSACNFVSLTPSGLKYASGAELGEDHFHGGNLFSRMDAHGNAAPIIDNRAASIGIDLDEDGFAEACHGFVDGIIDDFPDEMVQPAR